MSFKRKTSLGNQVRSENKTPCALLDCSAMSAKSAISKEIFAPLDERMLGAVQVKRRTKKKIPFLATGGQGEYLTYICLSVTNKKPTQASITKVKQFEGSTSFVRRSQWMLEQLRQVNGIDPNRDSAEFDLLFENAFDQWVASTASEKCTFFQILHHTCQRYLTDRKPEFINCQSKIMGVPANRMSGMHHPLKCDGFQLFRESGSAQFLQRLVTVTVFYLLAKCSVEDPHLP
uniref:Syntaxin binding protein 6 n=1 Tax=Suricata suricatta TaxID=37032 RepID=A0A673U3P0_SURSU